MRQDFFTYVPKFKLLIAGNHLPRLGGITDALKRRLVILPFEYRPATPDRELSEKLRAEYPAILAWMIEGAKDWYEVGLSEPERITRASQEYISAQDIFGGWLNETCQIDVSKSSLWTPYSELFTSWKTYAAQQNHPAGSSQEFAEQLARHGVRSDRKKQARGYGGIALLVGNLKVA
jgi:putative DNA primase/helicase